MDQFDGGISAEPAEDLLFFCMAAQPLCSVCNSILKRAEIDGHPGQPDAIRHKILDIKRRLCLATYSRPSEVYPTAYCYQNITIQLNIGIEDMLSKPNLKSLRIRGIGGSLKFGERPKVYRIGAQEGLCLIRLKIRYPG